MRVKLDPLCSIGRVTWPFDTPQVHSRTPSSLWRDRWYQTRVTRTFKSLRRWPFIACPLLPQLDTLPHWPKIPRVSSTYFMQSISYHLFTVSPRVKTPPLARDVDFFDSLIPHPLQLYFTHCSSSALRCFGYTLHRFHYSQSVLVNPLTFPRFRFPSSSY